MPDPVRGVCDSHTHVFAPPDAFPRHFATSYDPPPSGRARHLAMLDGNGADYGVIVQPAVYGTDPAVLLDALAAARGRLRAVAVADEGTGIDRLAELHRAGVRGLRFTEMRDPAGGGRYRGTVGLPALHALAPAMRQVGLHAQLWCPLDLVLAERAALRALGLPVVLDHMGCLDVAAGVGQPAFRTLLATLAEGWLWVKLTLCRVSRQPPPHDDVRPFHQALADAWPDRLLWGSDWPFVRLEPVPEPRQMLDLFWRWTPDAAKARAILAGNPAHLYGFGEVR